MTRVQTITIEGFIVGRIWQGIECYSSFQYFVTPSPRIPLRDHVAAALAMFGRDYASCVVAAGSLHIDVTTIGESGRRASRSRMWALDHFPSLDGLLHADPEWLPNVEEPAYA